MKQKESKKIVSYMDLAGELKDLCNMKVKVIIIVVNALRMVPKGLEKRLKENWISEEESLPFRPQHG